LLSELDLTVVIWSIVLKFGGWVAEKGVQDFMDSDQKSLREFLDASGCVTLVLLVNITGCLNKLNCHFQGKDEPIHTLHHFIESFQIYLAIWECQLNN
jgi:hypothetical protein